jgi:hypothetical protein
MRIQDVSHLDIGPRLNATVGSLGHSLYHNGEASTLAELASNNLYRLDGITLCRRELPNLDFLPILLLEIKEIKQTAHSKTMFKLDNK